MNSDIRMEESNTDQESMSGSENRNPMSTVSLVCYDVSSDSDNEMECTDTITIKLEPSDDDSPEVVNKEIEFNNDNSPEKIVNENLVPASDANFETTNVINEDQHIPNNNSLSNFDMAAADQDAQNNTHELICDAEPDIIVENSVNKINYRQTEEIDLSSDSEEDSSSSESSDESSCSSDDVKITKLPAIKPQKKKTKDTFANEINFPPIEDLQISIEEKEAKAIGVVFQIVDNQVVVQAFPKIPPIDLDSILFLDCGKQALGKVFDVFGSIQEPLYVVIFNTAEQVKEKGIEIGRNVYFAPENNEHTSYVVLEELLGAKGSDASWRDNNEPPPLYIEYSDDEEERQAKRIWKQKKMVQSDSVDTGPEVICCGSEEEINAKRIKSDCYNKNRFPRKYGQCNNSSGYQGSHLKNHFYRSGNIYSRGPPQFGPRPMTGNQVMFRSPENSHDPSNNNGMRPIFGGPPQFPTPPRSFPTPPPPYSPFVRPPPSPSPNQCPPFLCTSPGPPQLWQGSISPLPSCPPPPISPNPSSFYRIANQEPPALFHVPPPHYPPPMENNLAHETNSAMRVQNRQPCVPQQNTSNLLSQIPPATIPNIAVRPPPIPNQCTPVTIMSHTGHTPLAFCSQRPPPTIPSHHVPPQVLSPPMSVTHQILNPTQKYLPRGPPPVISRLGSPSPILLQPPARPPSPFLLLQRSPPPQLQPIQAQPPQFMQLPVQSPQLMSNQSFPQQGMPPPRPLHPAPSNIQFQNNPVTVPSNVLPPPINYQMPPPTHLSLNLCPPPPISPSQGPPSRYMLPPPSPNFSPTYHYPNHAK